MLNRVKEYKLAEGITLQKLLNAKFEHGGWLSTVKNPKVHYFRILDNDIELHIEIPTSDLENFVLDESKNVCVFDDEIGQPYHAFYNRVDSSYVNKIIDNYNTEMDILVNNGILEEKPVVKVKK